MKHTIIQKSEVPLKGKVKWQSLFGQLKDDEAICFEVKDAKDCNRLASSIQGTFRSARSTFRIRCRTIREDGTRFLYAWKEQR